MGLTSHRRLAAALLLLLLQLSTLQASPDWEHEYLVNTFNKRTLLSPSRSRSSLAIPWKYLARQDSSSSSVESAESGSAESSTSVQPQQQQQPLEDDDSTSSSSSVESLPVVQVVKKQQQQRIPVIQHQSKGEVAGAEPASSEEDDRSTQPVAPKNLIQFSYYPITQHYTPNGQVVYEIEDSDLRTSRQGWGWGKGKKKKCKKGKKGKGKKKKGKGKKKGKKGCTIKGGWWYVWDKKHGYLAGRWGDPPPKGLEREHYHHNFGKLGHSYGQGYDGHGSMGWKVKGWGQGHGHGGGGGGFGGYGGGGYGGGGGHHGHHGHQHGWGHPVEYYGWGWAEKQKGWGWRR